MTSTRPGVRSRRWNCAARTPRRFDVAGKIQGGGFVIASLDWQLSPALRRKAHDKATTAALMARVKSAASTLGLQVHLVQQVTLDGPPTNPGRPSRCLPAAQA
jgi:hypothetical protein